MAASLVKWMIALSILNFQPGIMIHREDAHPFYVSVIEINHNAKDKVLEISCKAFTNDFETALEKTFNTKIDLNNAKSKDATDKMIAAYTAKHLLLKVDGKPALLQFVGSEVKEEGDWSYFQVINVPVVKQLEVSTSMLYESFETEINILHVTVGGTRKSLEVTNPNNNASFDF
jgi:hypothetical protein